MKLAWLQKIGSSLYARFMFWTAALLIITVGMIIFFLSTTGSTHD